MDTIAQAGGMKFEHKGKMICGEFEIMCPSVMKQIAFDVDVGIEGAGLVDDEDDEKLRRHLGRMGAFGPPRN